MKSDFSIAVTQLAAERKLPKERILSAIEAALVSAYKKDNETGLNITVRLNPATGEVTVFTLKDVVEQVEDPSTEIAPAEAKQWKRDAVPGDVIEIETTPQHTGRIAAQTAKQVVMQRLREAERELVYEEYAEREGEFVTGTLQRVERFGGRVPITVDLDRTEAILPPSEQAESERYRSGQKMKFLILEVRRSNKGPEVILSRTHKNLLKRLFELEVPEIYSGIVEIKSIAREAGSRSKVTVVARQEGVDPVGSCVGLRGIRIQNIVNELQGEKIDVIQWHRDPAICIANALSPAQPVRVDIDAETQTATAIVPDKQLSLAIGREGQNARLAAKLVGWRVDIKSSAEAEAERLAQSLEGRPIAAARMAVAEPTHPAPQEAPPTPEEAPAPLVEAQLEAPPAEVIEEAAATVDVEAEPAASVEEAAEPVAEKEAVRLSPEEELLALELKQAPLAEEKEEISEDVWKVPEVVSQGPQIRFAEDILGPGWGSWGAGRRPSRRKKR